MRIAFVVIYILNPILLSIATYTTAIFVIRTIIRTPARPETRFRVRATFLVAGLGLALWVMIDTAFAFRRVQYGNNIPQDPVVMRTTPVPASITIVNGSCEQKCLDRLVAGVHTEIIFVQLGPPMTAERFTVTRRESKDCPRDAQHRLERQWLTEPVLDLQSRGICPVIEQAVMPETGIFVVKEFIRRKVREPAVEFKPKLLIAELPGPVSYYNATEVQYRSATGIEVLGRVAGYEAPGYLGFPPMVGCFERPDNVLFVLPPGEPGCGLWRMTTQGGNQRGGFYDGEWVYSQVFQPR